jgi:hypothetical protein
LCDRGGGAQAGERARTGTHADQSDIAQLQAGLGQQLAAQGEQPLRRPRAAGFVAAAACAIGAERDAQRFGAGLEGEDVHAAQSGSATTRALQFIGARTAGAGGGE